MQALLDQWVVGASIAPQQRGDEQRSRLPGEQTWLGMLGENVFYNFASGRPYDNPNSSGFLAEKTKSFNSLNLSWAYLISPQKILYVSASNVLGADSVQSVTLLGKCELNIKKFTPSANKKKKNLWRRTRLQRHILI